MNQTAILQHHLNKMGVVTVMDVLLKDTVTGEPILLLDTLKITSISQEGENKTIRGGIGAPELIDFDFARSVSVEIQDALASMTSLQMLWGGRFIEGDIGYTAVFEAKIKDGGGEKKVIEVPTEFKVNKGADLTKALIISKGGNATYTAAALDGQKVELGGDAVTTAEVGEEVKVFLLAKVEAGESAMALAINSIDLPPTVHMVGSTFFINQAGKKVPMEIEIPLLKINIGGQLVMEAEGDAAVFDFNGKALQDPKTKNLFILKQLPQA